MRFLVSGIGTDVGKTVVSAVLATAWGADYWKPVQTGAGQDSDRLTIERLTNHRIRCYPEVYALPRPVSPDAAAASERVRIEIDTIVDSCPAAHRIANDRPLIIEGAGGLLVPLNDRHLLIDLAHALRASVIIVSRHYLGSINHTLMSVECARARRVPIAGLVFVGDEHPETEASISRFADVPIIGRVPWMTALTPESIQASATFLMPQVSEAADERHGAEVRF